MLESQGPLAFQDIPTVGKQVYGSHICSDMNHIPFLKWKSVSIHCFYKVEDPEVLQDHQVHLDPQGLLEHPVHRMVAHQMLFNRFQTTSEVCFKRKWSNLMHPSNSPKTTQYILKGQFTQKSYIGIFSKNIY